LKLFKILFILVRGTKIAKMKLIIGAFFGDSSQYNWGTEEIGGILTF
jgi:hypothetical protein